MRYKTAWLLIRLCDVLAVACVAVIVLAGLRFFWILALLFCVARIVIWQVCLRCPHCHNLLRTRPTGPVCPDCGQPLDPTKL